MPKKYGLLSTVALSLLLLPAAIFADTSQANSIVEPSAQPSAAAIEIASHHWQLIERSPRPAKLFTQGLVIVDDTVYESVGMRGRSALIQYTSDRRNIAKQTANRPDIHAEGLVLLNNHFYQGSWQSREIFVFDRELVQLRTIFSPTNEVWGITTDGTDLIITDSGDQLIYLDPATGAEKKRVTVHSASGQRFHWLNELEWVDGKILANIWHSNWVVEINPATGLVERQFDFSPLISAMTPFKPQGEQVLNGLAWDNAKRELLVTGKEWPFWFTVRLDPDDKKDSVH